MIDWKPAAADLAATLVPSVSRWHRPLTDVPRHQFVPRWWDRTRGGYVAVDGAPDPDRWLARAYSDTSLVTRVGTFHADQAAPGTIGRGRSTSSSTHPALLVQMFRHAHLVDGMDVLDVGTGSGYGTALLCARLGARHVESVDIDPYLVQAARERLAAIGMNPAVTALDATQSLPPARFDRIIASVAVSPIPPAWIAALRPGGRIVTVLDGTRAILTADKQPDGTLSGRIERDWAGFMSARHSEDYAPGVSAERLHEMQTSQGEHTPQLGLYPLANPADSWELYSNLAVQHPGIEVHWEVGDGSRATCLLLDQDGSWARAEGVRGRRPDVYGAGAAHLWRALESLKTRWLNEGTLPLYGARATVAADGSIRLVRGQWECTLLAPSQQLAATGAR